MITKHIRQIAALVGILIFGKGQVDAVVDIINRPEPKSDTVVLSMNGTNISDVAVDAFNEVAVPQPQVRLVTGSVASTLTTQISVGVMATIVDTDSLIS